MNKIEIFYDITEEVRPNSDGGSEVRYRARMHRKGKIGKREFLRICRETYGIQRDELLNALGILSSTILALAAEGYSVDVPHLGHFQMDLKSESASDRKEAGDAVKHVKLRYRSSGELKQRYVRRNITLKEHQDPSEVRSKI